MEQGERGGRKLIEFERIRLGQYRSTDGRFTISHVFYGRCLGDVWILVDNSVKMKRRTWKLREAKAEAENILAGRDHDPKKWTPLFNPQLVTDN